MIVDKINKYLTEHGKDLDKALSYEVGLLAQWSFERQFMTDNDAVSNGKIRLSASGKCPRQNAYKFHGIEPKGKEVDSRSKFTFFAGDICEVAITMVARAALKKYGGGYLTSTGRDQVVIQLPVNGHMVEGHPDGLYIQDKTIRLVEIKSMSSFGYQKFDRGEIDDSYIAQINVYMECLGVNECVFIAYNKDSNVLGETIIKKTTKL